MEDKTDGELTRKIGAFYWVHFALDPDARHDWENEQVPARYAGKAADGRDLWLAVGMDEPTSWGTRWVSDAEIGYNPCTNKSTGYWEKAMTEGPITLEDRLDALKSWLLKLRADPFVHTRPETVAEIDLHLSAVEDALEAVSPIHDKPGLIGRA